MPIQEQDATRRLAFCQLVNDNDVSHHALSTLYFLLSRPASFHFASRYPFDIASLLRLALRAAGVSPHHYILNSRLPSPTTRRGAKQVSASGAQDAEAAARGAQKVKTRVHSMQGPARQGTLPYIVFSARRCRGSFNSNIMGSCDGISRETWLMTSCL